MRRVNTVLFLSANRTGSGKSYLDRCEKLGFTPILFLDPSEDAQIFTNLNVRIEKVDLSSADSVLAAINQMAEHEIVGVISSSEYYQELVADVAQRLGLPSNKKESVRACRNKSSQREVLQQAGIPQPRFIKASSTAEAMTAFKSFGAPVVVKPVDETGSIGVRMATTEQEVLEATKNLFARSSNARGMPVCQSILVEEYIDAPEFSAEIFDGKVVGITKKYLGPTPTFLEIGHVFPAPINQEGVSALTAVAEGAVAALGLSFGPMHVELKLTSDNRPFIIEVNPRLAGGSIPRLLELTGVNLIEESIRACVGASKPVERLIQGAAAIWFIRPTVSGLLEETNGQEAARAVPGVAEVSLYVGKNHPVTLRGDFRDRIGHVITHLPSAPLALNKAKEVCESISISMRAA